MAYKNPNDQYKIAKAPEMIKELNKKTICPFTTVITYAHLKFNKTEHAGTLVHKCIKNKEHTEKCECSCEVRFFGWN